MDGHVAGDVASHRIAIEAASLWTVLAVLTVERRIHPRYALKKMWDWGDDKAMENLERGAC